MASSLIANALQINFDSVLGPDYEGMVTCSKPWNLPVFEEKEADKEKEIEPVATEGMSLETFTDSKDTEPLIKVMALTIKSTSDEESIPIDDLLAMIPTDMMLPSVTAEEPTKIKFGLAVNRRLYIIAKYREMLLRKFLEARNKNFVSGTPTTAIDLKILEMLSDAHLVALEKLKEQMRAHKLEWTCPVSSRLFEGVERDRGAFIAKSNTNIIYTCWIRRLLKVDGVWKIEDCFDGYPCIGRPSNIFLSLPPPDTYVEEPVVDTETDPTVALGISQRSLDADLVSPLSYSDSPMHFTIADIPLGDEPTVVLPPDLTNEFAQLRASVDQI
ncbi:golgin subfamily B member 1-like [Dorcoceras hygrometricum]|uniref:Golgin subfamily B member 1-like n=1 Tax=Dorcoceras hygrometricum TaxID=472368 RepID=A0A2Z7CB61_9LAMI|nr:golgin subfamily B member 1-like [Dorcoceras hygrometricum]